MSSQIRGRSAFRTPSADGNYALVDQPNGGALVDAGDHLHLRDGRDAGRAPESFDLEVVDPPSPWFSFPA